MLFVETGFNSFSVEFILLYIKIYDHMLNKLTSIKKKGKRKCKKVRNTSWTWTNFLSFIESDAKLFVWWPSQGEYMARFHLGKISGIQSLYFTTRQSPISLKSFSCGRYTFLKEDDIKSTLLIFIFRMRQRIKNRFSISNSFYFIFDPVAKIFSLLFSILGHLFSWKFHDYKILGGMKFF